MAAKKKAKPKAKKKKAKLSTSEAKLPATKIGEANGISTGRPKGAKNKTTLVKEAIKGHWDELMVDRG